MTLLSLFRKHDQLLALFLAFAVHELKLEARLALATHFVHNVGLQVQVIIQHAAGKGKSLMRLVIAALPEEVHEMLLSVAHKITST